MPSGENNFNHTRQLKRHLIVEVPFLLQKLKNKEIKCYLANCMGHKRNSIILKEVGSFMIPLQVIEIDYIFEKLSRELPLIFARKDIPKYLGKSISIGTLANATSAGYGPPCIRNGRNTIYEKESFLEWFKVYLKGGLKAIKESYSENSTL